jgi:hypothetical protein
MLAGELRLLRRAFGSPRNDICLDNNALSTFLVDSALLSFFFALFVCLAVNWEIASSGKAPSSQ